MTRATVQFGDAAINDILEQSDWYEQQSGETLATRWENAVTSAVVAENPRSGPTCAFTTNELQGIRRMRIEGFPKHLIFYRVEDREILILRVVHGTRDLESLF